MLQARYHYIVKMLTFTLKVWGGKAKKLTIVILIKRSCHLDKQLKVFNAPDRVELMNTFTTRDGGSGKHLVMLP